MTTPPSLNPKNMAKLGEEIYKRNYQAEYEAKYLGKYVAINVRSQSASIGDTPDEALEKGKSDDPQGLFHLIRVGFPSAFQMTSAFCDANPDSDWIFR